MRQLFIPSLTLVGLFTILPSLKASATAQVPTVKSKLERQYRTAVLAQQTVRILRAKTIANDLRKELLSEARPEDLTYVKSMIAQWKPMPNTNAEFDQIVIRDEAGGVRMRMQRLEGADGTYLINGRKWVKPETGSIETSLRRHLAEESKSAQTIPQETKYFASIVWRLASSAQAAETTKPDSKWRTDFTGVAPAYLFAVRDKWDRYSVKAKEALTFQNPNKNLERADGLIENLWGMGTFSAIKVRCEGKTAKGAMKISGRDVKFTSREDGSVIFSFTADGKTVLMQPKVVDAATWSKKHLELVDRFRTGQGSETEREELANRILSGVLGAPESAYNDSVIRDIRHEDLRTKKKATEIVLNRMWDITRYLTDRASNIVSYDSITFTKCTASDCSKVDDATATSQTTDLIPLKLPESVQLALNWKPKDSTGAKIVREMRRPESPLRLEPKESALTGKDARAADELIREANREIFETAANLHTTLMSVRPLGTCCGDEICRMDMVDHGVDLVPKNSGATTAK